MAQIQSSIFVSRPVAEIFSFLNTCESHRKFIPRMTKLDQTSPGIFGQVGTRLSGELKYFGIRIPVRYELIEVESNQKLAMKGQMGPIRFKDGYILQEKDGGTEIQFWLELFPGSWARMLAPFMGLIGKIHAWETLKNLRRELTRNEIASSLLSPPR